MKKLVLIAVISSGIIALLAGWWPSGGQAQSPLTVEEIAKFKKLYRGREVFVEGYVAATAGDGWFISDVWASPEKPLHRTVPVVHFAPMVDEGEQYAIPESCLSERVVVHGRLSKKEYTKTGHFSEVYTLTVSEASDRFEIGDICYENS